MKLLLASAALIALFAFAHLASAAEEEAPVKTEVKAEEAKKEDGDEMLDSRYNGGGWKGGNGGKGNSNNGRGGGSSNNNDNSGNNNSGNNGRGGGSRGGGRGGGRGSNNNDDSSGNGNGNGNGSGNRNIITNQRVTNKVIPGRTSVLPTRTSFSKSTRIVASTRRNTFRQNSESRVSQLNKVKQTNVNTHLSETIHRPLTINTYKRHHHTQYIIRKQPYVTNVQIDQSRDRYQPAVKNVVIYTNDQSVSKQTLPTIVHNSQRSERLRTIWEAKRNLGTKNIGSALNEGAANIGGDGGGVNEIEVNIGGGGGHGGSGGRGGGHGGNKGGHGGCNGAYC